jgi:hypothetical protein
LFLFEIEADVGTIREWKVKGRVEGSGRTDLLYARRPDGRSARVVDEMSSIHESDALDCRSLSYTEDGRIIDERLVDGDDAGDHVHSNDAESKFRFFHRFVKVRHRHQNCASAM